MCMTTKADGWRLYGGDKTPQECVEAFQDIKRMEDRGTVGGGRKGRLYTCLRI